MAYKKIEPQLIDFYDFAMLCRFRYYDDGSRSNGDSGDKCRSRSKRKDEAYCSQHDCPLCECPTLEEIKNYDMDVYREIRELIIQCNEKIEDYEGVQPYQLPCANCGSEYVIQYYELIEK